MLVVFSPPNLRRSSEEAFKLARGYAVEQMRIVQCRAQRSACGMTSVPTDERANRTFPSS